MIKAYLKSKTFILNAAFLLVLFASLNAAVVRAEDSSEEEDKTTTFIRGAYQAGSVLGTNDFLNGENQAGKPIDSFQSGRVEFGWQTDGRRDWHHVYNMPKYGIGFYGSSYDNDEELGTPTSLYGFFEWPVARKNRWTFNVGLNFGFTNNWESYDPVNNPANMAMGLGRSVHIEVGANAEYQFAKQWSVIGGFSGTHFSNGGTQRPNHGLNQIGPILFAKYATSPPAKLPTVRDIGRYDKSWDLTVTGSVGKRNLTHELQDAELRDIYLNRNYMVGNMTLGAGRSFSHKARYVFGLDVGYDESVADLIFLEGLKNGTNPESNAIDNYELAAFAGFEMIANRTHVIVHLGYKLFYKDVEGRLPVIYQRLGVKQFVYQNWFAGLNVRFHELGSADNLEWTVGYAAPL
ncbi:MAG: hypothetical protein ACI9UK_001228 [Candidatus Krumholzibacteriia bacterium]|jgi:hypothetical protein